MSENHLTELKLLLEDLKTDINLSTTRDQHIRAVQRFQRLDNFIKMLSGSASQENC